MRCRDLENAQKRRAKLEAEYFKPLTNYGKVSYQSFFAELKLKRCDSTTCAHRH